MHAIELKIPPLAVFVIFAAMAYGLAMFLPGAHIPLTMHPWLAVVTAVIALTVAMAGVLEFHRTKTTVNPLTPEKSSALVASGVFNYTRNPMYLGMAFGLLATVLWLQSIIGFLLVPLFCAYLTVFQIKPEERALQQLFGAEFDAYLRKVRRWI